MERGGVVTPVVDIDEVTVVLLYHTYKRGYWGNGMMHPIVVELKIFYSIYCGCGTVYVS